MKYKITLPVIVLLLYVSQIKAQVPVREEPRHHDTEFTGADALVMFSCISRLDELAPW